MPGTSSFDFGAYKFGGSTLLNGVIKEDLLEQITNIDPWETPWVSQAPKVGARHVYHQWLTDTLSAQTLAGGVEGAD